MNKILFFLSGMPRTGSTVLGSIMSQHPSVHVTPTSPLYSLLVNTNEHFNLLNIQYTFDMQSISNKVYSVLGNCFYEKEIKMFIFDKHRGWPKHIDAIRDFLNPRPRIVATVRPIAEIMASYITLADRDSANFIDVALRKRNTKITNEARAYLLWTEYLKTPYECLQTGLKNHPENILLVEYKDIVNNTKQTLERIYKFCDIPPYEHTFTHIKNTCAEQKDDAWGMKNLHTIRPTLEVKSVNPLDVLPMEAVEYFNKFNI